MDDFFAARLQMAFSLGFHIVFSCIGMVMPFFMCTAHYLWLKKKKEVYLDVTKAWSKGVAIFFATGAVSGTVLSFELGLLWPKFMVHAGPIFGMPFSLEGTAFFVEAIALGFYLYGWNRFQPWFHWFTGIVVGITGLLSGILVVAANSWMNSPSGFDFVNGQYLNIDPMKAMFNAGWFSESLHMCIAAFVSTGFAVAGVHALMVLKGNNVIFHRKAFHIAAIFACIAACLQPISGDHSAKDIAKRQPEKLAAMEAHFHTQSGAPLIIGGMPDVKNQTVKYAIEIPKGLSFMATGDINAPIKGIDSFPKNDVPPVPILHYAFQIMVSLGMAMLGVAVIYFIAYFKKKTWFDSRWLMKLFVIATPMGYLALEAGWTVTEVGRQPWIIYKVMRTSDAVTPMPGIIYSFYLFTAVYISLAIIVSLLLYRQITMVGKLYDSSTDHKI